SFPARSEKIFLREGTPELASPCRLFGRRNQTRPRPSRGDFEARLSAVQRQTATGDRRPQRAPKSEGELSRGSQQAMTMTRKFLRPPGAAYSGEKTQPANRGNHMKITAIASVALLIASAVTASAQPNFGAMISQPNFWSGSNPNSHYVQPYTTNRGTYV